MSQPKSIAERAEDYAASPCPFCGTRPVERVGHRWACRNCDEGGFLEVRQFGYSTVTRPMPWTPEVAS